MSLLVVQLAEALTVGERPRSSELDSGCCRNSSMSVMIVVEAPIALSGILTQTFAPPSGVGEIVTGTSVEAELPVAKGVMAGLFIAAACRQSTR